MTRQRSILLFEQAIKSEATKKTYKYQLEKFRSWAKIKNYDGLLQAPQKQIQELLEDYVMHLKKTVSANSVPIYFAPIELFYVMNDINLNFKKIRKLFPDKVKKGNSRGYTKTEIREILQNCKTLRNKALVYLFSSSGVRLGAIPGMKLRHLSKISLSFPTISALSVGNCCWPNNPSRHTINNYSINRVLQNWKNKRWCSYLCWNVWCFCSFSSCPSIFIQNDRSNSNSGYYSSSPCKKWTIQYNANLS